MSDLRTEISNWLNDTAAREAALVKRMDGFASQVVGHSVRLGELERQAHRTHSRHEEPTYREAKAFGLIVKLEERVEALERTSVKRDMARGMDYEQVHPDEMARLRRIELAARELAESEFDGTWPVAAVVKLAQAVKR